MRNRESGGWGQSGQCGLSGRFRAARVLAAASTLGLIGACASEPPPAPKNAAAASRAVTAPGGVPLAASPVTLLPLAAARPLQLAAISITSLDRLLTNGATLAGRAVPLPIEPAGLRDMLLGQAGLSPEVAANLDLASPSGAAVVSTGQVGVTGLVMAVAARGPAEAERVIGALGKQVVKRGQVVLVDNGSGGRGWLFRDGNLIVFSDDVEALARGARLAEEARHAGPEDVSAVLYPEAIARANGTDVKTAIALMTAQIAAAQQAAQPSGPGTGGPGDHSLESMTQMLLLIGDAETIELGLVVDPGKGVGLRARFRAKPGTPLEGVARDTKPFEVDTTLLSGGGPPVVVAASSVGPFSRALMMKQRERLAALKAKVALEYYDAYMAGLAGQFSLVLSVAREAPLFSALVSYPMKDAAAAANLFAAMGRMNKAAVAAVVEAQMGTIPAFDWSVKKESAGKLKVNHFGVSFGKKSGLDLEIVKKVLGKALDVYVAVVGTRVVATMGRNAKPNISRLATAPAVVPSGALAEAMAASKNRDAFFFMDLGPAISLVGAFAKDTRTAALARAGAGAGAIPIFGTAGGDGAGKIWSMDLTIPPAAFVGAGAIVKGMSGAALGSGGEGSETAPGSKKAKKKKPASK
jgi:hypothetical protein